MRQKTYFLTHVKNFNQDWAEFVRWEARGIPTGVRPEADWMTRRHKDGSPMNLVLYLNRNKGLGQAGPHGVAQGIQPG